MSSKSSFYDINFWGIILILLLTVHLDTAIFLGRLNLNYTVFGTRLPHLLVILGSSFIALFTPLYYLLKRINPRQYKNLLKLHMFGNTSSLLLVSTHFVYRLVLLPLGIGELLFFFVLISVLSGFIYRFNILKPFKKLNEDIPHYNRFLHISLTISFYLVLVFHLLNVTDFQ